MMTSQLTGDASRTRERTPVNLLWTGGWDSTFRLLCLLVIEEKRVRPYYVIDTERESTLFELRAMERIKALLFEKYPKTQGMLLPTVIALKADIPPDEAITNKHQRLASSVHVGVQYEWLARFARAVGLHDLELCIEKYQPEYTSELQSMMLSGLQGEGHDCRMRDNLEVDELSLFRDFCFPTIHLTKLEMKQLAEQYGFSDFLWETWFCHTPSENGLPCGECRPCCLARQSGCGHKFARRSLVNRVYWKVNSLVQKAKLSLTGC